MNPAPSVAPTVDADNPWAVHATRIRAIEPELRDVLTYRLEFEDPEIARRFSFQPGQFNMLYLPGVGESAISISSDPDQPQHLLHTVRAVGNVTSALARKRVGDSVLLRGPFGSAWPVTSYLGHDLVIVAGGLGLAPVRPLLHYVINRRDQFGQVWLLYGARTPGDLLFPTQYESWRNAGIDVQVTVDLGDERWEGQIGVVTVLLNRLRLNAARTRVMTCGPEVMMRFVIAECLAQKIDPRRIDLSMERNMNCALGFCGHCQLGPAFVCKDGPVFNSAQMEPYLHVEDF